MRFGFRAGSSQAPGVCLALAGTHSQEPGAMAWASGLCPRRGLCKWRSQHPDGGLSCRTRKRDTPRRPQPAAAEPPTSHLPSCPCSAPALHQQSRGGFCCDILGLRHRSGNRNGRDGARRTGLSLPPPSLPVLNGLFLQHLQRLGAGLLLSSHTVGRNWPGLKESQQTGAEGGGGLPVPRCSGDSGLGV